MAFKKKRTFFYAGSQKLPDSGAGEGSGNGTSSNNAGGGGGGGYNRFNRFNRNKNNGDGAEEAPFANSGPSITLQVCLPPYKVFC